LYIRFHGNYSSPKTGQPYGIFVVIYHLHRDGHLSEEDRTLYLHAKQWFEEHLPNPPFYEDNNFIKAVTWFKDCPEASGMIDRLEPLLQIAHKHDVEVIRSVVQEPPGIIIYEDDFQVGVTKQF
jgi:hypothetical protein